MVKKLAILFVVVMVVSSCAVSGVVRKTTEGSAEEYTKWVEMFKARMNKMPTEDIAPFTIWVITIIGEDKTRLPREAEKMVDKIYTTVTSKPDDYKWTNRERAELMGSWDRLFLILYEEAYRQGKSLIQKIVTAGVL